MASSSKSRGAHSPSHGTPSAEPGYSKVSKSGEYESNGRNPSAPDELSVFLGNQNLSDPFYEETELKPPTPPPPNESKFNDDLSHGLKALLTDMNRATGKDPKTQKFEIQTAFFLEQLKKKFLYTVDLDLLLALSKYMYEVANGRPSSFFAIVREDTASTKKGNDTRAWQDIYKAAQEALIDVFLENMVSTLPAFDSKAQLAFLQKKLPLLQLHDLFNLLEYLTKVLNKEVTDARLSQIREEAVSCFGEGNTSQWVKARNAVKNAIITKLHESASSARYKQIFSEYKFEDIAYDLNIHSGRLAHSSLYTRFKKTNSANRFAVEFAEFNLIIERRNHPAHDLSNNLLKDSREEKILNDMQAYKTAAEQAEFFNNEIKSLGFDEIACLSRRITRVENDVEDQNLFNVVRSSSWPQVGGENTSAWNNMCLSINKEIHSMTCSKEHKADLKDPEKDYSRNTFSRKLSSLTFANLNYISNNTDLDPSNKQLTNALTLKLLEEMNETYINAKDQKAFFIAKIKALKESDLKYLSEYMHRVQKGLQKTEAFNTVLGITKSVFNFKDTRAWIEMRHAVKAGLMTHLKTKYPAGNLPLEVYDEYHKIMRQHSGRTLCGWSPLSTGSKNTFERTFKRTPYSNNLSAQPISAK